MDKEPTIFLMSLSTMASGVTVNSMGWAPFYSQMEICTKDNFSEVNSRAMERLTIKLEATTRANSNKAKKMAKVSLCKQMEFSTQDIGKMIKEKVMACSNGATAKYTKDSGSTINFMEMES